MGDNIFVSWYFIPVFSNVFLAHLVAKSVAYMLKTAKVWPTTVCYRSDMSYVQQHELAGRTNGVIQIQIYFLLSMQRDTWLISGEWNKSTWETLDVDAVSQTRGIGQINVCFINALVLTCLFLGLIEAVLPPGICIIHARQSGSAVGEPTRV